MVIRSERKRKSYLGNRTRGAGDTKNRRGAGCKGGKGRAGKWKHKKVKYAAEIGTKIRQTARSNDKTISLFSLNSYVNGLLINKIVKEDKIVLDFKDNKDLNDYAKVVGNGNIDYKVNLKNVKFSKSAEDKVKARGGSFE